MVRACDRRVLECGERRDADTRSCAENFFWDRRTGKVEARSSTHTHHQHCIRALALRGLRGAGGLVKSQGNCRVTNFVVRAYVVRVLECGQRGDAEARGCAENCFWDRRTGKVEARSSTHSHTHSLPGGRASALKQQVGRTNEKLEIIGNDKFNLPCSSPCAMSLAEIFSEGPTPFKGLPSPPPVQFSLRVPAALFPDRIR